jgi:hypothetical protein
LLAVAVGVNSASLKLIEALPLGYRPPRTSKTHISEFLLGREAIEKHQGHSMHVFLLNIPRLEFAALIPKDDFLTFCLLGRADWSSLSHVRFNAIGLPARACSAWCCWNRDNPEANGV